MSELYGRTWILDSKRVGNMGMSAIKFLGFGYIGRGMLISC